MLHTEDGGKTPRNPRSSSAESLSSVTFTTSQLGWAVGDNGTMLHTEDGGNT